MKRINIFKVFLVKMATKGFLVVVFFFVIFSFIPIHKTEASFMDSVASAGTTVKNIAVSIYDFFFQKPEVVILETTTTTSPTSIITIPPPTPAPVIIRNNTTTNTISEESIIAIVKKVLSGEEYYQRNPQSTPGTRGERGSPGATGSRGPQGPQGDTGDTRNLVTQSAYDNQVDGILTSIENGLEGLSESLSEEVSTTLLTVSGNGTIGGNLNIAGSLITTGIINSGSQTITSTSSPQFRIQYDASNEITTAVSSTGATTFGLNGTAPALKFTPALNSTNTFNFTNAASTSVLSVDTLNGRVGVGTTTPAHLLDLVGTTTGFPVGLYGMDSSLQGEIASSGTSATRTVGFNLLGTSSNTGDNWVIYRFNGANNKIYVGDSGSVGYINSNSGHNLYLGAGLGATTSSIPNLTLLTNGNVGIGDTTPDYLLDVAGTSGFDGVLTMTGSASNIALGSNYLSGDGDDEGIFIDANGVVAFSTSPTSSSGGYAGSEKWGSGAIITGTNSLAVGYLAAAGSASYGSDVALGKSATATSGFGTSIGVNTSTAGSGTAVGHAATTSSTEGTAVGIGASAGHNYVVALGAYAATTAANQFVMGRSLSGRGINDVYIGEGVTLAGVKAGTTLNATGGAGVNDSGGNITIAGGKATGNAVGGSIIFSTSDAGVSGATLQSLTPKMTILPGGNVGIGMTSPDYGLTFGAGKQMKFYNEEGDKILFWGTNYGMGVNSQDLAIFSGGTVSFHDGSRSGTTLAVIGTANSNRKTFSTDSIDLGIGNNSGTLSLFSGNVSDTLSITSRNADNTSDINRLVFYNRADVSNVSFLNSNVGIGVTNPGAKLDVNGNIYFSATSASTLKTVDNASAPSQNLIIGSGNGLSPYGTVGSVNILGGNNTQAGGNLGTGGAINIIAGNASPSAGTGGAINITAGNGLATDMSYGGSVTINGGSIGAGTLVGNVILANLRGNVGIGITNPGSKLQISGAIAAAGASNATGVTIDPTLSTGGGNGLTQTALAVTPTFNTASSHVANAYGVKISPLHTGFYTTTNAYGLYVDATSVSSGIVTNNYAASFMGGNVGIGTTSPGAKLEVVGQGFIGKSFSSSVYQKDLSIGHGYESLSTSVLDIKTFDQGGSHNSIRFDIPRWSGDITFSRSDGTAPGGFNPMLRVQSDYLSTARFSLYPSSASISDSSRTITGSPYVELVSSGNSYINAGNVGIGTTAPADLLHLTTGNIRVGASTAVRSTTAGTNQLILFNGTAPVGTLVNGISMYSTAGEAYIMDAAGNATLQSPHENENNYWVFDSRNAYTGKTLLVDMELLIKDINDSLELDYVHETIDGEITERSEGTILSKLFSKITLWMADAGNGIGDIFSNRVRTKEICVEDEGGQTCLNRSQLDALILNTGTSVPTNGTSSPTSDPAPGEPAQPTPDATPSTNSGPNGLPQAEPLVPSEPVKESSASEPALESEPVASPDPAV